MTALAGRISDASFIEVVSLAGNAKSIWKRLAAKRIRRRNALRFIEPHPPLPVIAWTVPTHPHSEFSWR